MNPTLQSVVVAAVLLLVPVLLYRGKLRALLFIDLAVLPLDTGWQVVSIRLDLNDLILVALVFGLLRRRDSLGSISKAVPHLRWWGLLGVVLSISYVVAPINDQYLSDPVRMVYQLYRYCWKPILYYPLVSLTLREPRTILAAFSVLVVLGDIHSVPAIPQGYSGTRAGGLFTHGNALGAALVVPLVLAAGLLFSSVSRRLRIFYVISLVLMTRALTFTHSRGALIASVTGVAFVAIGAMLNSRKRSQLLKVTAVLFVAILVLFAVKPDILERPNMRRALTATSPLEQSTFKWRLETRWPHFWNIALEHPLWGVGTAVDATLGDRANTPHNGYLAVAVKYGFPALVLYLLFAGLAAWSCARLMRRTPNTLLWLIGTLAAAGLIGLLVHNIDESNFLSPYPARLFWILTAFAIIADRGSRARSS